MLRSGKQVVGGTGKPATCLMVKRGGFHGVDTFKARATKGLAASLPSKQVVAGSNPVSRSTKLVGSLLLTKTP